MIAAVPNLQSEDRVQNQSSQNIISALNQLLKNPLVQGNFVKNTFLSSGSNVIPHGLGRTLQGWSIVDINADADIYRSAPLNAQNLTLTTSADVTVSLYVF